MGSTIQIGTYEVLTAVVGFVVMQFVMIKALGGHIWKTNEQKFEDFQQATERKYAELQKSDEAILKELRAVKSRLDDKMRERIHRIELALERRGIAVPQHAVVEDDDA